MIAKKKVWLNRLKKAGIKVVDRSIKFVRGVFRDQRPSQSVVLRIRMWKQVSHERRRQGLVGKPFFC